MLYDARYHVQGNNAEYTEWWESMQQQVMETKLHMTCMCVHGYKGIHRKIKLNMSVSDANSALEEQ